MSKKMSTADAVAKINKAYGAGAIMNPGKDTVIEGLERVPFEIPSLDKILGGGMPKGRIIEIYGPESSSKTTFCLHLIEKTQKEGGEAAIVDSEHSLDLQYAEHLGIDLEKMYLSQPSCGEEALEIVDFLLETDIALIIIDSVAALTPRAEIEGEMGDSKMGLHARLMSQAMRKMVAKIKKSNTTVIFTNQLRSKIGVVFGNPETTTGGNALKFYASIRIDVRAGGKEDRDGEPYGQVVRVKAVKNKTAIPFQKTDLFLIYGEGYSQSNDILNICIAHDIIKKSGSWFSYGDTKLGQGFSSIRELISDNPELTEELLDKIKECGY